MPPRLYGGIAVMLFRCGETGRTLYTNPPQMGVPRYSGSGGCTFGASGAKGSALWALQAGSRPCIPSPARDRAGQG